MKKIMLVALMSVFMSLSVFAHGDHAEKEYFTGPGLNMVHVNSILVGTFDLIPIWAEKVCGSHIKGQYKVGEEIKTFAVELVDKKITGTFGDVIISFVGIDKDAKTIKLKVNDEIVTVYYENEAFETPHYHHIKWSFMNGEKRYSFESDGEACMGSMIFYSTFLYGLTTI